MNQLPLPGGLDQAKRQGYKSDDALYEMLRYIPAALFEIDIEPHYRQSRVKISFFNNYFFVLTEYTQDEINAEGIDPLKQLIYYQDHRIVRAMFGRLTAGGMFTSVSRAFRVATRNEASTNAGMISAEVKYNLFVKGSGIPVYILQDLLFV